MSSAMTACWVSKVARIGKMAPHTVPWPGFLCLLFVLVWDPASVPAAALTLNGLEIAFDDQTGGIRSMRYAGVGELLSARGESAGLLDLAWPIPEFVPLRLATCFSRARINRSDVGVTITYDPLGASRTSFRLPSGGVKAVVTIRAAGDRRSTVFRCRIENRSGAQVSQILFPDLRGLRRLDDPRRTRLRLGCGEVYPFEKDPREGALPYNMQLYWSEYAPALGMQGIHSLRWLDLGSNRGGLSLFERRWDGQERPIVRTCRNEVAADRLRLTFDFSRPIPPGQTWESSEIWLTPHRGGWAKGIETYREYVRQVNPVRQAPKHIQEGFAFQTAWLIESPEKDPDRAYFKFRDLPRIAADAKTHGVDELSMINWCECFTMPVPLRRELGTREELVAAVRQCKRLGVNVSPFYSIVDVREPLASKLGVPANSTAWTYHPEMVPGINPYYLTAGYPVVFWRFRSMLGNTRHPGWQKGVRAALREWIDAGLTSVQWDVFDGNESLVRLAEEMQDLMRRKDPTAVFSGESVGCVEWDNRALDYTWNNFAYCDCGPVRNVLPIPRVNIQVDEPNMSEIMRGFCEGLYLNFMPGRPGNPLANCLIGKKPRLSAAARKLAALRRQFLPYFSDGLYLGDCVGSASTGIAAYGHQLGSRLLIATVNLSGTSESALECDLGLWLPPAKRYSIRTYDGDGKLVRSSVSQSSVLKVTALSSRRLELAFVEAEAQP